MATSPWNAFPPIKSSKVIEVGEKFTSIFDHDNHLVTRLQSKLLFGQTIQFVSDNDRLAEQCRQFVIDTPELQFLVVKHMPISVLIEPLFLETFHKTGQVLGFSVNVDVNMDDTVAFLPDNTILLSLNAATYNRLGLVGKPSTLNRKGQTIPKYHVQLDLNQSYFRPGKKHYEHVYQCLRRLDLRFDFAIKWEPSAQLHEQTNVSPNSLEGFFHSFDSQLKIERCCPSIRSFTNRSVPIITRKIDLEDVTMSMDTLLNECIDWCEAQMAQVDFTEIDHEVSSFQLDTTNNWTDRGNVHCVQLKGFFTANNVDKLRRHLRQPIGEHLAGMIVHSFVDVPQCWRVRSHHHYKELGGDALYGCAQLNGQVITWTIADCYDFGIEA